MVQGTAGAVMDGVAVQITCSGAGRNPDQAGALPAPAPGYAGAQSSKTPAFAGVCRALEAQFPHLDIVTRPADAPGLRLLVADMDSTMITVECIDELADYAGVRDEVAAVTERAMAGELDFEAALRARVELLAGLSEAVLAECHAERVRMMPGARSLVRTMVARGGSAVLVTGGFDYFASRVATEIGFTGFAANRLGMAGGRLTGTVEGPVIDAAGKRDRLERALAEGGIDRAASMAIGDGANDRLMVAAAGLGVAYHARPALAEVADARVVHGDLTTLLYAQGIARRDWAVF